MSSPVRAVLLDFDGLILDTETPEVHAWREMFSELGCEYPDECWQRMIGQSSPEVWSLPAEYLSKQLGRPVDSKELLAENERRRVERLQRAEVQPGVERLLDEAQRRGLKTALVSSSSRCWVEGHLTRLGLLSRFDAVICGGEGHPSKPDPALYRAALETLGIRAAEAIAIEDSPNGVRAAKAAGIYCIAVPNELTRRLSLDHADRVLDSLEAVELFELHASA